MKTLISAAAIAFIAGCAAPPKPELAPQIKTAEFIYEQAPFASCHASTIAETKSGLVAAWFGGTAEKNRDVAIWVARHESGRWTPPVEVVNGVQLDGTRQPCWNPVLFQPRQGPLLLFYKVGPDPSHWWGMLVSSSDDGKTWTAPRKLPAGILGPIKNKPIQLADGTLLCGSSTEDAGWRVHFERTPDLGKTWMSTKPLNYPTEFGAIQPTILVHKRNSLQALCRTKQQGVIAELWSRNNGENWDPMKATSLPNPNSGIDAVTLKDGRHVLVYNHTTRGRTPLNVAISTDGKEWRPVVTLESESGEYSYPAVIQTRDGLVHATYTWKRKRIKHVVLDLGP
jgi:predicted neuraminidase